MMPGNWACVDGTLGHTWEGSGLDKAMQSLAREGGTYLIGCEGENAVQVFHQLLECGSL